MSEIRAENLIFKYNGNVIAKASSASIEVSRDAIDTTTLDNDGWTTKIGGNKSWTGSADGMVIRGAATTGSSSFAELFDELVGSDDPVELIFETGEETGDITLTGEALITSLNISGSVGEVLTHSVSFEGSGALAKSEVV